MLKDFRRSPETVYPCLQSAVNCLPGFPNMPVGLATIAIGKRSSFRDQATRNDSLAGFET